MTLPVISDLDLTPLSNLMPGLDFTDPERSSVLKEMGSCDVQAAPGSGKTTLLAAKLMLLAASWKHSSRGICVISHTNVAANEITRRLQGAPFGASLLSYPHFVGTIHSFINSHLALPMLRSAGIEVESIDNEVFARKALGLMSGKWTLKNWAARRHDGAEAVQTMIYVGNELEIGSEKGTLPGRTTPSGKQAEQIKTTLTERGIFRHADMFAFAASLLKDFPSARLAASWRFPLVLIDEMQDTDEEQEALLNAIFDDSVVMQRYGDRNQRILSNGKKEAKLSFPRPGALTVTSTKRFPASIAAIVSTVQEYISPITSTQVAAHPPAILLYDDSSLTSVIDRFGAFVLERLGDDELKSKWIKAICARKSGESTVGAGRHIRDYYPSFAGKTTSQGGGENIRVLLSDPPEWGASAMVLASRARDVSRAILLCLRAGRSPLAEGVRDAGRIFRSFQEHGVDSMSVRLLRHRLTTATGLTDESKWPATVSMLFNELQPYFHEDMCFEDFSERIRTDHEDDDPLQAGPSDDVIVVTKGGRSVSIQVATTASVKGETHVATLVLDGVVRYLNKHDIGSAMESIALGKPMPRTPASIRGAYRGLYVGMSRPTTLLALATHKDRISVDQINALEASGWIVLRAHP